MVFKELIQLNSGKYTNAQREHKGEVGRQKENIREERSGSWHINQGG